MPLVTAKNPGDHATFDIVSDDGNSTDLMNHPCHVDLCVTDLLDKPLALTVTPTDNVAHVTKMIGLCPSNLGIRRRLDEKDMYITF